MKQVISLFGLAGSALALGLFTVLPVSADPMLVVDDDGAQCPGAGYVSIQAAVNAAAPNATIRVCPGTYDEQVIITKRLKLKGDNGAVVKPSPMAANTTSLSFGAAAIAAAILVMDTTNVTLEGLTVDGSGSGIVCGPNMIGIYYRNASGKVKDAAVRHMKSLPGGEGCQSGLGIFVQSGAGGTAKVEVENSSVHDYQKNGITGNGSGTELKAKGNVVTGIGPTTGAGQNGIQIGYGATGEIEDNKVMNHIWSPCVSVAACEWIATNILIYDSDDVKIAKNTAGKSQTGIYLQGNRGKVEGNHVFDTDIFDGLVLFGDDNKAENNTITHSDEAAIFLLGDGNKVTGNKINEAPIGVPAITFTNWPDNYIHTSDDDLWNIDRTQLQ
ncbi:MAG: right-handed parallel beta-helix repeat-containing protein, partial [Nitrospirae bacterium]|nr:right-handed parallel beta-helix repeat-containing protein [Nitrospirota bacterium]